MLRVPESERTFLACAALLFAASAAITFAWCGSMASTPGMPMPGGWTMSMAWMRMPGQSWPGAAAAFTGMWAVMMIAMMSPVLVPILVRYRHSLGPHCGPRDRLTVIVGASYFSAWTAAGAMIFPLGVAIATALMEMPALSAIAPLATAAILAAAGVMQTSAWKRRQLSCCRAREYCHDRPDASAAAAMRLGLRLGVRCLSCCATHTTILLVLGVMELWAMAAVMLAICLERLAPGGDRIARCTGAMLIAAGLLLVARHARGA